MHRETLPASTHYLISKMLLHFYIFVLPTITKYCKLSDLDNRNRFLTTLDAEKFHIKVPAHSVPGEVPG